MNNIVYKISKNLEKEMIEHYKSTSKKVAPPYTVFQSIDAGTTVTLYQSGKVMFQGISADIDYAWWRDREKHLNDRDIDRELADEKRKKEKKNHTDEIIRMRYINTVGSDEVGTGDYFGPIVVCASYVTKNDAEFLENLHVRDSKKLSDTVILDIAPKISKRITYTLLKVSPKEYNDEGITNMNKVKAILHNKAIASLLTKIPKTYDEIIIDQFAPPDKYYEHIKDATNIIKNIHFMTKAEDKCLSVAVSSIIARYEFLMEMKNLSEKYGMTIPKGANPLVDEFGKEFVAKYGFDELINVAKLNFKNTEKIKKPN